MMIPGRYAPINPKKCVMLREALLTGNDDAIPKDIRIASLLSFYEILSDAPAPNRDDDDPVGAMVRTIRTALLIDETATIITLGRWAAAEIPNLLEEE
jgi:hypothetical protein